MAHIHVYVLFLLSTMYMYNNNIIIIILRMSIQCVLTLSYMYTQNCVPLKGLTPCFCRLCQSCIDSLLAPSSCGTEQLLKQKNGVPTLMRFLYLA